MGTLAQPVQQSVLRADEQKRRQTAQKTVRPNIDQAIEFLSQQIDDLDDDLNKLIQATPLWLALVAVMRKRLTILNTIARSKQPWTEVLPA